VCQAQAQAQAAAAMVFFEDQQAQLYYQQLQQVARTRVGLASVRSRSLAPMTSCCAPLCCAQSATASQLASTSMSSLGMAGMPQGELPGLAHFPVSDSLATFSALFLVLVNDI
jgi:hypothetical protein